MLLTKQRKRRKLAERVLKSTSTTVFTTIWSDERKKTKYCYQLIVNSIDICTNKLKCSNKGKHGLFELFPVHVSTVWDSSSTTPTIFLAGPDASSFKTPGNRFLMTLSADPDIGWNSALNIHLWHQKLRQQWSLNFLLLLFGPQGCSVMCTQPTLFHYHLVWWQLLRQKAER